MVAVAAPEAQDRLPSWLHDAAMTIRAIDVLDDIGALDALGEEPTTAGELAVRTGTMPRPLELALEIASLVGITTRDVAGRWTLADRAGLDMMIPGRALSMLLKDGTRIMDGGDAATAGRFYTPVVKRIGDIAAHHRATVIPRLRAPGQRVIELAAGASPWGRALCEDDAGTRITAVDLPDMIGTTRAVVEEAGLSDRYDFVSGDVFTIEDLDPADLIVVAGFCRLLGPDRNAELFRRVARWGAAGGRVAVIDAVATPQARAAGLSRYELGLLTRTTAGRCWTLDHYARWLVEAGFVDIDLEPTSRPELTLVTARKAPPG